MKGQAMRATCEFCGREYERPPSTILRSQRHFCSHKCFTDCAVATGFKKQADIVTRFWAKVNQNGPMSKLGTRCWLWTGSLKTGGYGQIFSHHTPQRPINIRAHRWIYEQLVGPIPTGLQLDHLCHNADLSCRGGRNCLHRSCVNPAHLDTATNQTNKQRAETRKRRQANEKSGA